MRDLLISGTASVILAVLGFALGRMNLKASTSLERNEELRRRQIDTYAAFCASVVEYGVVSSVLAEKQPPLAPARPEATAATGPPVA